MQMFADFHQDVSPRNSLFDAMARPDQRCTHGQREQFILRMLLRHNKLKPQEYNCIAGQFRLLATNTTSPRAKDSHGKNDYLIGDNIIPKTVKTLSTHMEHLDLPLD